jgi:signal recognition particle receptor subunit beta
LYLNQTAKQITLKVVYVGPSQGGKTTNINYVFQKTQPEARGTLLSQNNELGRTLFFDYLPLELGEFQGYSIKAQLYSEPGEAFYDATRKMILKGLDGLIFVADSQVNRLEANLHVLERLQLDLAEHKYSLENIPHVIQYNKRDLSHAVDINSLNELLNPFNAPVFEAVAVSGVGVMEPVKAMTQSVLRNLSNG